MGGPIDMKRNEYESIRHWAHNMTKTFGPTHDLELGFSRSDFEITVFEEWMDPDLF